MQYQQWLQLLRADALCDPDLTVENLSVSTYARLRNISEHTLGYIFQQGIQPTVKSVTDWCAADPEALADLIYWRQEQRNHAKPATGLLELAA